MSKLYKSAAVVSLVALLAGCQEDSAIASHNISKAADNFEVTRKVVFYNGITGDYMLELVGRCSIKDSQGQLEVTCRTAPSNYVKHFLGLSDNVTYFVQQVEGVDVSVYHNRITWKPQSILPDIDLRGDVSELTTNRN
tara:strand:- start:304 stop:717 length:414 start_codon:yes stop_codon:yes gene_type:complete